MKKFAAAAYALALLVLCGWMDARETNLLSPVSAASLSYTELGDTFVLTVESVWQDSTEGTATPQYISAEADNLPQLYTVLANSLGGDFYFSHAQVFVIDEAIAREGLLDIAVYLCDAPDVRLDLRLAIARGCSADEIITAWAPGEDIPGFTLGRLLSRLEERNLSVDMPLYKLTDHLLGGKDTTFLPCLTLGPDGQAVPAGTAVIENGRLTRFEEGSEQDA